MLGGRKSDTRHMRWEQQARHQVPRCALAKRAFFSHSGPLHCLFLCQESIALDVCTAVSSSSISSYSHFLAEPPPSSHHFNPLLLSPWDNAAHLSLSSPAFFSL